MTQSDLGSRNFGLMTRHRAGIRINAPMRQDEMDTTTRNPKNLTGMKLDVNSTMNPTMTDNALKTIPLPVVVKVFLAALCGSRPFCLSYRYLQR